MTHFDLLIKGGTVATAVDTFAADIGINDGKISALGSDLQSTGRTINAEGKLVLPGGVESHCHIAQESSFGLMSADDYESGSVSAAFGGNTTMIPFASQKRGQSLYEVLDIYHERAASKSVIDYSYHLILSDPGESVLKKELPAVFDQGIMSFKVFMTYDLVKLDDGQMLDVLDVAREHGALTMVHAENSALINWVSRRLLERGYRDPKYHAVSHPRAAEVEAVQRAVQMAEFIDAPMLIVHVSTEKAARAISTARYSGSKIFGETCPHYLFLTSEQMNMPGPEAAKFCCSPPLRDNKTQEAMWQALQNGTFQLISSDHAAYRYDETGKLNTGPNPTFKECANGVPGIELRMPLMYSEGVRKGRISLNQFVSLTSTNAAKMFGLHPRKGTIAVGTDADIAIWDPDLERRVSVEMLHDNMNYTPYEGFIVKGWPTTVINRGRVVIEDGTLKAAKGSGEFLKRKPCDLTGMPGNVAPEFIPEKSFNARLR
ncbi:MAG: dihydropyrimidinase [SAR324 cluster bacterium]|nr:dihydropyrimidinase [SAR324 cluster bacterium]